MRLQVEVVYGIGLCFVDFLQKGWLKNVRLDVHRERYSWYFFRVHSFIWICRRANKIIIIIFINMYDDGALLGGRLDVTRPCKTHAFNPNGRSFLH